MALGEGGCLHPGGPQSHGVHGTPAHGLSGTAPTAECDTESHCSAASLYYQLKQFLYSCWRPTRILGTALLLQCPLQGYPLEKLNCFQRLLASHCLQPSCALRAVLPVSCSLPTPRASAVLPVLPEAKLLHPSLGMCSQP